MKPLLTLEQHNQARDKAYGIPEKPEPAGIACPCGEELLFVDSGRIILCYPPKKAVRCPKCGFQGFATV